MTWRRWFYRNVYLKSPYWRLVRYLKLKQHGLFCDKCHRLFKRKKYMLNIHHPYYRGLIWRELWQLNKLQVLCRSCHAQIHGR